MTHLCIIIVLTYQEQLGRGLSRNMGTTRYASYRADFKSWTNL